MKKMICEICGSQSIKKENGVFVCQECGTEYSLEEAKKLLKEISGDLDSASNDNLKIANSKENKYELIKKLSLWIESLVSLDGTKYWFDIEYNPCDSVFWSKMSNIDLLEPVIPPAFKSINSYDERLYIGDLQNKTPRSYFNNSSFGRLVKWIKEVCLYYWYFVDSYGNEYKRGYRYFLKSTDGSFYKSLRDMVYEDDTPLEDQILNMSKSGKTFYVHHVTAVTGFFRPKLEEIDFREFSDTKFNITNAIKNAYPYMENLKKYDNFIVEQYKKMFPKAKENYSCLMRRIGELEELFFVPLKYRSPNILYYILNDILLSGRAEDWKEAINMYETDKYREDSLKALSDISSGLQSINNTLKVGLSTISSQLSQINIGISSAVYSLNTLNDNVKNIAKGVDFITFDTLLRD